MTTSDLLRALSQLINKRYPGRLVTATTVEEDPPGVRLHELRVRQTSTKSRREIVMSIVGDELPRTLSVRHGPQSKMSVAIDEDGLFTMGSGEKLTMEGFVRHVFAPWFGGYQVF